MDSFNTKIIDSNSAEEDQFHFDKIIAEQLRDPNDNKVLSNLKKLDITRFTLDNDILY